MRPAVELEEDAKLMRAIGLPGLAANIVNTTIGASIFVLPALVAGMLGAAAPLAFLVCALAMGLFVTSFAIAGSRVSLTGGLYAYVEVAFGPFIGFLAAALAFLAAILSVSGVVSLFTNSLTALLPALDFTPGRFLITFIIFAVLAWINVRGVRHGARVVELVTVIKLLPLLLFVGVGIFFINWNRAFAWALPSGQSLGQGVLLLIFAFAGVEVALVPSGEVISPARTLPRAIYLALAITTTLYILIQLVAQGTLGAELGAFTAAPLAEAAGRFSYVVGRNLLLVGATISAFGYVTSDILSSPRILFALGRDRFLPKIFAHVHARFRTPDTAIVAYCALCLVLSLSSSFQQLAILANVAVLLLYLLGSAAAFVLMRRDVRSDGAPFTFTGAAIVPPLAIIVIIWILAHATRKEFTITGIVLVIAAILFLFRRKQASAR